MNKVGLCLKLSTETSVGPFNKKKKKISVIKLGKQNKNGLQLLTVGKERLRLTLLRQFSSSGDGDIS